jgi:hypothetical protein
MFSPPNITVYCACVAIIAAAENRDRESITPDEVIEFYTKVCELDQTTDAQEPV